MVIIETDILVALASKTDKHHSEAKNIVSRLKSIKLSPYALIELDLLISSKLIIVKLPDFYERLNDLLMYYNISVLPQRASHFAKAWKLRQKYGLTYFDSLHAAAAIEENDILVSYDRKYSGVKELKYRYSRDFEIY